MDIFAEVGSNGIFKDKKYLHIQYDIGQTYAFCAKGHVGSFRTCSSNKLGFDRAYEGNKITAKNDADLALKLARKMSSTFTKTVISDCAGVGMHRYISEHLPKEFTNELGERVLVLKEEPYRNRNSSNMVQEVVLHRVYE